VKGHFANVDRFIAPSAQLMEKYLKWGIEPERIEVEEYGRRPPAVRAPAPPASNPPANIGFFGQLSHFKGGRLMLEAMSLLEEKTRAHLWLHGANLELQTQEFQDEFAAKLEPLRGRVTFRGPYVHDELPKLMADLHWVVVPSIWWENSPLVIQEAFFHRRPIICSDVGGMAEKVTDGIDGIHFRVGDAYSLAKAIETATGSSRLWRSLSSRIREPYSMEAHVEHLRSMFASLIEQRTRAASDA
jgi:glycosyltransferase involved in cell wall biosynthesis